MSKTRVFKCFHCDKVWEVKGYLTSCPECGKIQGFIEGKLKDPEPVKTPTLAGEPEQLEFAFE